ncbi:MAG: methyltransferase domain-containing protein [Rickettsiales bacterium]|nr:methyltransferase domain-containing protein [Rickettsiales bacterium]
MTSTSDKIKIAHNFSKAADQYNRYAKIQKEIASELFFMVKKHIKPGAKILDLGCGTGFIAKLINTEFQDIEITQVDLSEKMLEKAVKIKNTKTIKADIEKLPLPYNHFDIIISSLALQWCDQKKVFKEIKRVKKPGAPVIISTLGENSFKEIKQDFKQIKLKNLTPTYKLKEQLQEIKIPNLRVKSQLIKHEYKNLLEFFHTIKNVGANTNQRKKYFDRNLYHICKSKKNYMVSWEIIILKNFI